MVLSFLPNETLPEKLSLNSGNNIACLGSTSVFSTNGSSNSDSYLWSLYPTTAGNTSSLDLSYTIDWYPEFVDSAYIKVKDINQCGDGEYSDSLLVTISSPTVSDIIEKSTTMLVSIDSGYTYQWYRDSIAINGATKQYYYNENMPTGDYQVEIFDENSCNNKSEIYTFGINTKSLALAETINIYPNPTNGKFTIEIINDYTGEINYAITNAIGQIIFQEKINKQTNYLKIEKDLLNLPVGIYLIEFVFENEKVTKQLIIEKF